jgi:hypothetical protein
MTVQNSLLHACVCHCQYKFTVHAIAVATDFCVQVLYGLCYLPLTDYSATYDAFIV